MSSSRLLSIFIMSKSSRLVAFIGLFMLGVGIGWKALQYQSLSKAESEIAHSKPKYQFGGQLSRAKTADLDLALELEEGTGDDLLKRIQGFKTNAQFEAELEKLKKLDGSFENSAKASILFRKWAQLSPKVALAASKNLDASFVAGAAQYAAMMTWAQNKPEEVAQAFLDGEASGFEMQLACGSWAKDSPKQVLDWISRLNEQDGKNAISSVIDILSQTQPEKLAAVAKSLPESLASDPETLTYLMSRWVIDAPEAALAWMNSLPAEQGEILKDYKSLDPSISFDSLMQSALNNPEALKNQINQFPVSFQQELWNKILLNIQALDGTISAKLWKDEHLPKSDDQATFTYFDFEKSSIPAYSPKHLRELIDSLPEGNTKRSLISNYCSSEFTSDTYPEALNYAYRLNPDGSSELFSSWHLKDPEAATRWLHETTLIPEERKGTFSSYSKPTPSISFP